MGPFQMKKALTIAGSDSGGGAGIQADLKTFAALGVFGASAITALTAQNTIGVLGIFPVTPEFVALQIDAVVKDIGTDAVKTGMLSNKGIIEIVASKIREHQLGPLVVDPVMVAKSGDALLEPEARSALLEDLIPLAAVVTPNLPEAEVLCGFSIADLEGMRKAATCWGPASARTFFSTGSISRSLPSDVSTPATPTGRGAPSLPRLPRGLPLAIQPRKLCGRRNVM